MRILQERSSEGQIFFVTDRDDNWSESKSVLFFVGRGNGTFQTYDIPMSTNPYWKAVITQLRLDPIDQTILLTSEAQIEIDYISVHAP